MFFCRVQAVQAGFEVIDAEEAGEEGGGMKTAAQKRKEKKERQKQKEEKKPTAAAAPAATDAAAPAVATEAPGGAEAASRGNKEIIFHLVPVPVQGISNFLNINSKPDFSRYSVR